MSDVVEGARSDPALPPAIDVTVSRRSELTRCSRWAKALGTERKDHRYYELVEDTVVGGYDHRYFIVGGSDDELTAVQPFFILDQDMLAGTPPRIQRAVEAVRRLLPGFLTMRTLMVGCVAGEGHLDGDDDRSQGRNADLLAAAIIGHARELKVHLIVLKEFPAKYRTALNAFLRAGFTRVPSLPMVRLNIDYPSFEDYVNRGLSAKTRKDLRKKFRAAERAGPITLTVVEDVTPYIDVAHPLYLQVFERSALHFEKLSKQFFCELGRLMPDKVKFFLWHQDTKLVAFSLCMIHDDSIYAEYLGLEYPLALDLHLYHYAFRDVVSWAMTNGYKWFCSSGLNYDPKLHLGCRLDPLDLYVRHTSGAVNLVLKRILPLIEPTRNDPILKKFPNYSDLWASS